MTGFTIFLMKSLVAAMFSFELVEKMQLEDPWLFVFWLVILLPSLSQDEKDHFEK